MTEQDFNQLPDHVQNALKEANIVAMCTHHTINDDASGVMGTTMVFLEAGCYMHNTELMKLLHYNGFVKIAAVNNPRADIDSSQSPSLKLVFWTVV